MGGDVFDNSIDTILLYMLKHIKANNQLSRLWSFRKPFDRRVVSLIRYGTTHLVEYIKQTPFTCPIIQQRFGIGALHGLKNQRRIIF